MKSNLFYLLFFILLKNNAQNIESIIAIDNIGNINITETFDNTSDTILFSKPIKFNSGKEIMSDLFKQFDKFILNKNNINYTIQIP